MTTKSSAADTIPIVSRVCADGTLVELLYDAGQESTALAIRTPDGSVAVQTHLDLPTGERLTPYSAKNNLITSGCVLLPSDVGDFRDKGDLVQEIQAFLHRYVDLSPLFEELAAYYVLLSWVTDAFNEIPFLRFRGDYGTGKTRALITVGSICYKPFFASGASTVSPIFHILDAFQGTLILDEADFRFSDATAELTKILNNGNMKGMPVLRTMTNRHRELNPQAFRVFGPKIIAMRESFSDKALESRFLTEETGKRPVRADISIHLPESLKAEALVLRNKLLAWRFQAHGLVGPDRARLIAGVEPRVNQTALALLSLIDDAALRQRIAVELSGSEARLKDERAQSREGRMTRALLEAFAVASAPQVGLADVAKRFNDGSAEFHETPMSNKWIGWFVRTRLRIATTKSNGVYAIPQTERQKIETLAARYGIVSA